MRIFDRSAQLAPVFFALSLLACNGGQTAGEAAEGSEGIPGDGDPDETTDSMTGDGDPGDGDPGDGDPGDGDPTGGLKFDTLAGPDGGGGSCGGGGTETLTGTVFAHNGTIPVVGAVVYVSNDEPEGIRDGVYCAESVELGCEVDFTETDVNGNFSLSTHSGAGKYLVVQKGQFMRVTPIDIAPGATDLPDAEVELPDRWDPAAGLYIPKIAIADGSYDRI